MAKSSEAVRLTNKLREDSGTITDEKNLVCFLYLLMRDHLTPGVVANLLGKSQTGLENYYTNGWLAQYAQWVAEELRGENASTSHTGRQTTE